MRSRLLNSVNEFLKLRSNASCAIASEFICLYPSLGYSLDIHIIQRLLNSSGCGIKLSQIGQKIWIVNQVYSGEASFKYRRRKTWIKFDLHFIIVTILVQIGLFIFSRNLVQDESFALEAICSGKRFALQRQRDTNDHLSAISNFAPGLQPIIHECTPEEPKKRAKERCDDLPKISVGPPSGVFGILGVGICRPNDRGRDDNQCAHRWILAAGQASRNSDPCPLTSDLCARSAP